MLFRLGLNNATQVDLQPGRRRYRSLRGVFRRFRFHHEKRIEEGIVRTNEEIERLTELEEIIVELYSEAETGEEKRSIKISLDKTRQDLGNAKVSLTLLYSQCELLDKTHRDQKRIQEIAWKGKVAACGAPVPWLVKWLNIPWRGWRVLLQLLSPVMMR